MTDGSKETEEIDTQMDIKIEPALQCFGEEQHENGFPGFGNTSGLSASADVGALNLWTSKATTCLISQYKKYRSMVGQTTQIRSLREMFEMISMEMQNQGFCFSPQKCENKWRVLERKYKNLVFRERLKKPGRVRHYGHWEHKRALDEIFHERKRHMYLEDADFPGNSNKYTLILPKPPSEQGNNGESTKQQHDPLESSQVNETPKRAEVAGDQKSPLTLLFEKFIEQTAKNFMLAEKNKERRHKEKMAIQQSKLEVLSKLLKVKEQKMELQKRQMLAAAQHFHTTMQ